MSYRRNNNYGGGNRGGYNRGGGGNYSRGGGGGRRGGGNGSFEQKELTGTLWGNQYRENERHPVLQGEAKVDGVMYKVAGFFNPSYENRDNNRANDAVAGIADEINNLLLEATEKYGAKFSLLLQDKAEWERDREANGGGGNRRSGSRRSNRDDRDDRDDRPSRRGGRDDRDEDQGEDDGDEAPFNQEEEEGADPEPEDNAPRARPAARRSSAAKPTGKGGKGGGKPAAASKRTGRK